MTQSKGQEEPGRREKNQLQNICCQRPRTPTYTTQGDTRARIPGQFLVELHVTLNKLWKSEKHSSTMQRAQLEVVEVEVKWWR